METKDLYKYWLDTNNVLVEQHKAIEKSAMWLGFCLGVFVTLLGLALFLVLATEVH